MMPDTSMGTFMPIASRSTGHSTWLMLFWLVFGALLFAHILYKFTIYAVPCLIGVAVGQWALATGAGLPGAFIAGLAAALLIFAALRWLFLNGATPLRWLVAAAVALTTSAFAYFLLDDISAGHMPSEIWRQILCVSGAGYAGMIAFLKLAAAPSSED